MATLARVDCVTADGAPYWIESGAPAIAAEVHAFLEAEVHTTNELLICPGEIPSLDDVTRRLTYLTNDVRSLYLTARADGRLIGVLSAGGHPKRRYRHTCEIGMLIGHDWRGRGVGRAMLELTIGWADAHPEIDRLVLGVFSTNAAGQALYRSLGFFEEGRTRKQIRFDDGGYADEILMARWCPVEPDAP